MERVSQLDALRLDSEMRSLLREQLRRMLALVPVGAVGWWVAAGPVKVTRKREPLWAQVGKPLVGMWVLVLAAPLVRELCYS